jgi:polar amino acid transport system substrate-binding protein
MTIDRPRLPAALALVITAIVVFAGCGGDDNEKSTTSGGGGKVTVDKKVAGEVPAKIKSKGTLKVASDATYPPNEFIENGSVVGMDADLAKALGDVMGLKVNVVNATFEAIVPGLAAHKYDLGMSSFTDTREREKVVDFVTYFEAGTSFYEKATGGPKINGLADLCGHKVAVEKSTTQADDVNAQNKKCKAAGKPAPELSTFPDQNGANLALSSGRAEIGMADSPVAAYQVKKTKGQFKLVGKEYGPFPYGIAIPKDIGMVKSVLDALKVLISNGTYTTILKKWGIETGAITNPGINKAIS